MAKKAKGPPQKRRRRRSPSRKLGPPPINPLLLDQACPNRRPEHGGHDHQHPLDPAQIVGSHGGHKGRQGGQNLTFIEHRHTHKGHRRPAGEHAGAIEEPVVREYVRNPNGRTLGSHATRDAFSGFPSAAGHLYGRQSVCSLNLHISEGAVDASQGGPLKSKVL